MKTIAQIFATLLLAGCRTTSNGPETAPVVAAIQRAQASTAQAIADNEKARALVRESGKGVIEIDGRVHAIRDYQLRIDGKATKALEILNRDYSRP